MKNKIILAVFSLFLVACDNDVETRTSIQTETINVVDSENLGFVAAAQMQASDFGSSSVALLELDSSNSLKITEGYYPETQSDYRVNVYRDDVYRIGRASIDNVTRFDVDNPNVVISQFSTLDDVNASTSNPYQLVFVSAQKAYLLRYGSGDLWVVNPSAKSQSDYLIKKIDLSAYDTNDSIPNMSAAAIVNNKLFVAMQRLNGFSRVASGYVAVIDVNTDVEIDTGKGSGGLKGVPLNVWNPVSLDVLGDKIYVAGVEDFGAAKGQNGGLDVVSASDYSVVSIIDTTTTPVGVPGDVQHVSLVNESLGYVVFYEGWKALSLYTFNPSTKTLNVTPVAGFKSVDIRAIEFGSDGALWVGVGDVVNPKIAFINPSDNSQFRADIVTKTIPIGFSFSK